MKTWLIGCPHLAHPKIYTFTKDDGSLLRPYADNEEDGDNYIIERYNDLVGETDRVYFMGDVMMSRRGLPKLDRMKGRKILIKGNHDTFKLKDYLPHFDDIRAEHRLGKVVLSHRPMHPDSIAPWCIANVHAHTHDRLVMRTLENGERVEDLRYINVCVERTDFRPIRWHDVLSIAAGRHKKMSAQG